MRLVALLTMSHVSGGRNRIRSKTALAAVVISQEPPWRLFDPENLNTRGNSVPNCQSNSRLFQAVLFPHLLDELS